MFDVFLEAGCRVTSDFYCWIGNPSLLLGGVAFPTRRRTRPATLGGPGLTVLTTAYLGIYQPRNVLR